MLVGDMRYHHYRLCVRMHVGVSKHGASVYGHDLADRCMHLGAEETYKWRPSPGATFTCFVEQNIEEQ